MSALQTLVQGVCALRQALAVGGVVRAIVELLLTERGAGLCFHRVGRVGGCFTAARVEMAEGLRECKGGGRNNDVRGSTKPYEARLSQASKLAHASPCTADKLVAGWSQGMLRSVSESFGESERVLGWARRALAIGWGA